MATSAEWTVHDWDELQEERAAIMEHDGGLSRSEAVKAADDYVAERRRAYTRRPEAFDVVWFWKKKLPERRGQRCRVLARSTTMNSIAVEFEDGFRVITGKWAVRDPLTIGTKRKAKKEKENNGKT